jgi:cell division transport system permease protein
MSKKESNITRRRFRSSYIVSTISITLVLLMLGLIGLLLLNAKKLSVYVKENIGFTVYLDNNIKDVDILRIQKNLDAKPYVKETKYITKEQAAVEFQKELGEDFIDFLGFNPLTPSIDVKLYAKYANPDSIAHIENDFKSFDHVREVAYQKSLVHLVNENVKKISLIILAFSGLLLLIAIALINNTIRLAVYSRRFLIRTMQLVGATNGFIRRPFLFMSTFMGVLGAILAAGILLIAIYMAQKETENMINFGDIRILGILFGAVLIIGIVINWISTYLAVTKYLKIKTDQLYT